MKSGIGIASCQWLRRLGNQGLALDPLLWMWFGVYLGWLLCLSLESLEGIATRYRTWIWLAGMANAGIVLVALAATDAVVGRTRHWWINWIWGGCVGVIAAAFYVDLLLFKMMALHVPTGLRLLFGNGWEQFRLTVEASGVREAQMREFVFWGAAVFIGGILVTRMTKWLSGTRPVTVRVRGALVAIVALVVVVTGLEWVSRGSNPREKAWEEVHRVMPFAVDLLHQVRGERLAVGPLREVRAAPGGLEAATRGQGQIAGGARPDIYIFILESARRDYVSAEVTPNLDRFAADCIGIRGAVASANATHLSWFSLLTATQPLHFRTVGRQPGLWGSVPLRQLRRAGYEVHGLTATHLGYHNVNRMIFGPDLELADSVVDATDIHAASERPARDREVTRRLLEQVPHGRGGRVFLVFYDSTHHDYYWPGDVPVVFRPVAERWNYFDFAIAAETLEGIKNRYRNALRFVDGLFGEVMKELREQGRYDDALIFVTGDHGEEFLEHGKLVHSSELWREQTEVPFLLKLPKGINPEGYEGAAHVTASHVDFLPTVLDCLGIAGENLFDGESIFKKQRDLALVADDNGGRDPFRFCLIKGDRKAWLRYRSDSTLIALERTLYLVNLTDFHDRPLPVMGSSQQERLSFFIENFGGGLSRLYPEYLNEPQRTQRAQRRDGIR